MTIVKIPASPAMMEDLKELQRLLGTPTAAETVRRAVTRELLLARAIRDHASLTIEGKNPKGKAIHVLM